MGEPQHWVSRSEEASETVTFKRDIISKEYLAQLGQGNKITYR